MKAELLKPTTDAELERYHNREEVLVARGIREVVEWITPHIQDLTGILGNPEGNEFVLISKRVWRTKLKEWGIK